MQKAVGVQKPQGSGATYEDDESKYESLIAHLAKKRVSKLIEITEKEYDPNAHWGEDQYQKE